MIDPEKIKAALEICQNVCDVTQCRECPYKSDGGFACGCKDSLTRDALILIKQQEQEIRFLKGVQRDMVGRVSNLEDLGRMVKKNL